MPHANDYNTCEDLLDYYGMLNPRPDPAWYSTTYNEAEIAGRTALPNTWAPVSMDPLDMWVRADDRTPRGAL